MTESCCADRYLETNINFSIIMYCFQKYLENYKTYVFHSLHRPNHVDSGMCNLRADLCKFQRGDMGCCHSHLHQFHILHLISEKKKSIQQMPHVAGTSSVILFFSSCKTHNSSIAAFFSEHQKYSVTIPRSLTQHPRRKYYPH